MTDARGEDARWMRHALELATDGMTRDELPIGAADVVDGEVVAEAHTEERTQQRLLVHADLLALDRSDRALRGGRARATLYVTLEPCLMCLGAAFTTQDARWERSRAAHAMPSHRLPDVRGGVLRLASAALFRTFADAAPPGSMRDWALDLAILGGA